MSKNTTPAYTTESGTEQSTTTYGIDPDEREEILLDELRVEIRRLADAVERQNELLEERGVIDR